MTEEKKPPADVNHYRDTYWNDLPAVNEYLFKEISGDKNLEWVSYVKQRYAKTPFSYCLVIGCGDGHIERQMFDAGIATEFDAFDCSEQYISQAKADKGDRLINYQVSSFGDFSPNRQYDLIVNVAALHHVDDLNGLLKKLSLHLSPEGIFVNYDYIGPNRNQYTDEHLKLMEETNNQLPARFRSKHQFRHEIEVFINGDITEAIHSAEILPTFQKYYDIIEYRELGGGIAYQILWNNIHEFEKDDDEARDVLQQLIAKDAELTRKKVIPTLHGFFVGRPNIYSRNLQKQVSEFYNKRMKEYHAEKQPTSTQKDTRKQTMTNKTKDNIAQKITRAASFLFKKKQAPRHTTAECKKKLLPFPFITEGWLEGPPQNKVTLEEGNSWDKYQLTSITPADQITVQKSAWSIGKKATLSIPIPPKETDYYIIQMEVSALLTKENNFTQNINITVNNEELEHWTVDSKQLTPKLIAIPGKLVSQSGIINITFTTPDATPNNSTLPSLPADSRVGVELHSFTIFDGIKPYMKSLQQQYEDACKYRDELLEREGLELQDRGEIEDMVKSTLLNLEETGIERPVIKKELENFLRTSTVQQTNDTGISFNEEYFQAKQRELIEGHISNALKDWRNSNKLFKEAVIDICNYLFRHYNRDASESDAVIETFLTEHHLQADKLKELKDANEQLNNLEILLGKTELESFPPHLEIEMTSFCNFRCVMCSRSMLKFYFTKQNDAQILEICRILPYVKKVTIAGVGEPCYSNKLDILSKVLNAFDCATIMFTNGSMLHNQLDAAARLAVVNISFDGPTDAILGTLRRRSNISKIIKNIKALRKKAPKLHIALNVVVSRINIDEISGIVNIAGDIGVNSVSLSPVGNVPLLEVKKSDIEIYEKNTKQALEIATEMNITLHNNVGHGSFSDHHDTPRDKEKLIKYFKNLEVPEDITGDLDSITKQMEKHPFRYFPEAVVFQNNTKPETLCRDNTIQSPPRKLTFDFDLKKELQRINNHITELTAEIKKRPQESFKLPYCLAVWKYAYGKSNGKNRLCPHRNVAVGNYNETSFNETINSEVLQRYRKSMFNKDTVTPMCQECNDHHRRWLLDSLRDTCKSLGLDLDSFQEIK